MEAVTFCASFPPIQSAIKIGDGARLQLDVPDSDIEAVKRLLDMRGLVLHVTITPEDELSYGRSQTDPA